MKSIFFLLFFAFPIFASDQLALSKNIFDKSKIESPKVMPVARVSSKRFIWNKEIEARYKGFELNNHIKRAKILGFSALGASGVSALGALEYSFGSQYPIVFKLIGWSIGGFGLAFAGLGALLMVANGAYPKSEIKLAAGFGAVGLASVLFAQAAGKILLGAMVIGGAFLALTLLTLAADQALKASKAWKAYKN